MKIIPKGELIREFKEKHPEVLSGVSEEQLWEVWDAPWVYLKEKMSSDKVYKVRFQYLGVFSTTLGKVKRLLGFLDDSLIKGRISEKNYIKSKNRLESFIVDYERGKK